MKKIFILLVAFLSIFSFYYFIFAQETEGTLSVDKQNYLLTDTKQCFTFSFSNETFPVNQFNVKLFSFGPNNRGCINGCDIQANRYLWYGSTGIACINLSLKTEDVGNWSAYITYNNKRTNTINYQVQSNLNNLVNNTNSTSTFNITFTANNLNNLYVAPGNLIEYRWHVSSDQLNNLTSGKYFLDSWYTADKEDRCFGGISQSNQVKPWIISNSMYFSGFQQDEVKTCQEGVNYTITLAVKDNQGNIFASKSINVSVNSKNQQDNYIPLDFCSKFENDRSYTYEQIRQILQPYYDNDKKSCDLQIAKYTIQGVLNLNDQSIPYSPNGDGKSVPPGVLYKADNYFTNIDSKTGTINRIKMGYIGLCSHFDNDLFSSLGFGPGYICSPLQGYINYCVKDSSEIIINSIKRYCNKNINIQNIDNNQNLNINSPLLNQTDINQQNIARSSIQNQNQNQVFNRFNPLNTDFYTGPVRLSYEIENNNQLNFSNNINISYQNQNNILNPLNGILSQLLNIVQSSKNLPSEIQSSFISQIQSAVSAISNLISNLSNRVVVNNQNQSLFNQNKYFIKNLGWGYSINTEKTSDGGYLTMTYLPPYYRMEARGFIFKLNSFGDIEWAKEIEPMIFNSFFYIGNNEYLAFGNFYDSGNGRISIIKINDKGEILSKKFINLQNNLLLRRVLKINNEEYIISTDIREADKFSIAFIVLDKNFNIKSSKKITYLSSEKSMILDGSIVKKTFDNGYIIGATLYGNVDDPQTKPAISLIKLKSDLSLEFSKKISVNKKFEGVSRESVMLNDVEELNNRNYLLIGNKYDFSSGQGYSFLISIDNNGNLNKFKSYDDFSLIRSINKTNHNTYLLTGFRKEKGDHYGMVLEIDSNLNILNALKINDVGLGESLGFTKELDDGYLIDGNGGKANEVLIAFINKDFNINKKCSVIEKYNETSLKDFSLFDIEISDISDKIEFTNFNNLNTYLNDLSLNLNISSTTRQVVDMCK